MDDDWDAMGGATETAAPAVPAADPFGGAEDPFDAPAAEPAFATTFADPAEDMFAGGDAAAAPASNDIFGGDAKAPAGGLDDMFGEPAPAAPAVAVQPAVPEPAVPQVDDSLIEEWERTKRAELQVRRDEAAKKKSVAMQAGKKAIEEFNAKREGDVQKALAKNQADEKETIASMEASLKAGLAGKESWEKVTSYLDLSSDPARNDVVSRMKATLIAVKSDPPANNKNFGA